ncbi:MAG: hypothetical protein ACLR7U_03415 [Ruthenibacterium lactatiformans]
MVDGALVMDFYDADFAADFAVSGSALVQSAAVDPGDGCTRVTLTFTQPSGGIPWNMRTAPRRSS